eukprot:6350468-Alexandrium_andersonii.AAC.1
MLEARDFRCSGRRPHEVNGLPRECPPVLAQESAIAGLPGKVPGQLAWLVLGVCLEHPLEVLHGEGIGAIMDVACDVAGARVEAAQDLPTSR